MDVFTILEFIKVVSSEFKANLTLNSDEIKENQ